MGIIDFGMVTYSGSQREISRAILLDQLNDSDVTHMDYLKNLAQTMPKFVQWMLDRDAVALEIKVNWAKSGVEEYCASQMKRYRQERDRVLAGEFAALGQRRDAFCSALARMNVQKDSQIRFAP